MRRFLKVVGIIAVFATALSYFAFRIVFFDPFEGSFTSLEQAVPRDCTFFARRRELERDFSIFPGPQFFEELRLKQEWKEFAKTDLYRSLASRVKLDDKLAEVEQALKSIEPLDVVADAIGRECMVLGRHHEDGSLALAVLFRGSLRLKFLVEAVGVSWARALASGAFKSYRDADGVHALTLEDGTELFLMRRLDLIAVGTDESLLQQVRAAADGEEQQRILDRPQVREGLAVESDCGRPVDFVADVKALASRLGFAQLKSGEQDPLMSRFLKQAVPPEQFGLTVGRLFLGKDVHLLARSLIDYGSLKNQSAGLFGATAGRLEDPYRFCGQLFPKGVFFAAYLRVKIAPIVRRMEAMLDEDARSLLNDGVRNLRSQAVPVNTVAELVDTICGCLGEEVAVALEPQAPYSIPPQEGKEVEVMLPNDLWGPRVALLFAVSDIDRVRQIVNAVISALKRERAVARSFSWTFADPVAGRYPFSEFEFGDNTIPPIAVGFIDYEERDYLVVTTTGQFLREIVEMRTFRERGGASGLGEQVEYRQAEKGLLDYGQFFLFCSGEKLKKALSDYAPVVADLKSRPDWDSIRRQVEQDEFQRQFPQLHGQKMSAEHQSRIAPRVQQIMEEKLNEWQTIELPKLVEDQRADLAVVDLFRWAVLTLGIVDEREARLSLRLSTPANFE